MSSQSILKVDFTSVDIDRIKAALAGLERPVRVTLKSLIESQRDAIIAARHRGLGFEEIANAITSAGCPITAATLRKYIGPSTRRPTPSIAQVLNKHAIVPATDSAVTARRSLRRSAYLASPSPISQEKNDA